MAQSYNSLIAKNTDTQQHGGSRTTLSPKVLIILILSNSYLLNTLSIILKKLYIFIFLQQIFLSGVENCSQTTYQHILI